MHQPLADKIRPRTLDEVCGQTHLLAKGCAFRRAIDSGRVSNMIFYGPPGVGKTTVARLIAAQSGMALHKLNGTSAGTAEIKEVLSVVGTLAAQNGVLLYLDEIQYLNKKQQQSLLECLEQGTVTMIAATTENPGFYIYQALLSRCSVFEFTLLKDSEIEQGLRRAVQLLSEEYAKPIQLMPDAMQNIVRHCGGDLRKALVNLEFAAAAAIPGSGTLCISAEVASQACAAPAMRHDKNADLHYDCISALQKSIRGSDPDAAIYYLARILAGGDLISACRRLLVIASEDIGLAYPQAVSITKACVDSAMQLGMPEAQLPLAQAAILLATAPKSNSAYQAIHRAMRDVEGGAVYAVPRALQNCHYDGMDAAIKGQHYQYPHDFANHWVMQHYLPDELRGVAYYHYGQNKAEQAAKIYWDKIKQGEGNQ